MQSDAATVEAFLVSLTDDRRRAIAALLDVIRKNIDADFEEGMQSGAVGWFLPHPNVSERLPLRPASAG